MTFIQKIVGKLVLALKLRRPKDWPPYPSLNVLKGRACNPLRAGDALCCATYNGKRFNIFHFPWLVLLLAILFSFTTVVYATPLSGPAVSDLFRQGGKAYDEGRYADSIQAYDAVLAQGHYSGPLLFNLANAHFKAGRISDAILYYQRAHNLVPRDQDINANLRFAMEYAGAINPPQNLRTKIAEFLTLEEWVRVLFITYWLTMAAGCGCLLTRTYRLVLLRTAGIFIVLIILSVLSIIHWRWVMRGAEVVVMEPSQEVLFGPIRGSNAHFSAPMGSILQVVDRSDPWLKVKSGKRSGYIPSKVCRAVYPLIGSAGSGRMPAGIDPKDEQAL